MFDIEFEFLSCLKNKEHFIDLMWQSKRQQDVELSVRSLVAN